MRVSVTDMGCAASVEQPPRPDPLQPSCTSSQVVFLLLWRKPDDLQTVYAPADALVLAPEDISMAQGWLSQVDVNRIVAVLADVAKIMVVPGDVEEIKKIPEYDKMMKTGKLKLIKQEYDAGSHGAGPGSKIGAREEVEIDIGDMTKRLAHVEHVARRFALDNVGENKPKEDECRYTAHPHRPHRPESPRPRQGCFYPRADGGIALCHRLAHRPVQPNPTGRPGRRVRPSAERCQHHSVVQPSR